MFLRKPFPWHLIREVQNTCDGPSCEIVMVQVRVDIGSEGDTVAERFWSICGDVLFHIAMDSAGPITMRIWDVGAVGFFSANSYCRTSEFG